MGVLALLLFQAWISQHRDNYNIFDVPCVSSLLLDKLVNNSISAVAIAPSKLNSDLKGHYASFKDRVSKKGAFTPYLKLFNIMKTPNGGTSMAQIHLLHWYCWKIRMLLVRAIYWYIKLISPDKLKEYLFPHAMDGVGLLLQSFSEWWDLMTEQCDSNSDGRLEMKDMEVWSMVLLVALYFNHYCRDVISIKSNVQRNTKNLWKNLTNLCQTKKMWSTCGGSYWNNKEKIRCRDNMLPSQVTEALDVEQSFNGSK